MYVQPKQTEARSTIRDYVAIRSSQFAGELRALRSTSQNLMMTEADDSEGDEDQPDDPQILSNMGRVIGKSTLSLNRTVMVHFNGYLAHLQKENPAVHMYNEYSKTIPIDYFNSDVFGTSLHISNT